jgi:hypothetical protein
LHWALVIALPTCKGDWLPPRSSLLMTSILVLENLHLDWLACGESVVYHFTRNNVWWMMINLCRQKIILFTPASSSDSLNWIAIVPVRVNSNKLKDWHQNTTWKSWESGTYWKLLDRTILKNNHFQD